MGCPQRFRKRVTPQPSQLTLRNNILGPWTAPHQETILLLTHGGIGNHSLRAARLLRADVQA
eukprot:2191129-Amphidinium_carterae.1